MNYVTQTAAAAQPVTVGYAFPGMMDDTQEAARTIASVESHLRHLQLQHAEAQHRMNELTKQAQVPNRISLTFFLLLLERATVVFSACLVAS